MMKCALEVHVYFLDALSKQRLIIRIIHRGTGEHDLRLL